MRILLVDDHRLMVEGLKKMLEEHKDLEVVGVAGTGREALKIVPGLLPDVVIMDITMPDLNGIDATRKITGEFPGVKVIALSIHAERQFVQEMLQAGASGYLLKDCALEELVDAVRTVIRGRTYLGTGIQGIVLKDYLHQLSRKKPSTAASVLTSREREVLQLIAEGRRTKEIAHMLDVSVKTVETHQKNIMRKVAVDSVAELTKFAIREGLTSLDA